MIGIVLFIDTRVAHSVTRTINFHLPNGLTQMQTQRALINVHQPSGQTQTITQWVTLKRSVKTDRVTGAKTYGYWSSDYWDEYAVPTFSGCTPSQSTVEETPVSSGYLLYAK